MFFYATAVCACVSVFFIRSSSFNNVIFWAWYVCSTTLSFCLFLGHVNVTTVVYHSFKFCNALDVLPSGTLVLNAYIFDRCSRRVGQ